MAYTFKTLNDLNNLCTTSCIICGCQGEFYNEEKNKFFIVKTGNTEWMTNPDFLSSRLFTIS